LVKTVDTLVVPFIFVPHGDPPPLEWMAAHPDWIRVAATFVPRAPARGESGPQWNAEIDFSDALAMAAGKVSPPATGNGGDYATTASALTAWRHAQATFADPAGAAGMRRLADAPFAQVRDQGWTFAGIANALLGIPSAKAQVREEEEARRRGPGGIELTPAEEMRVERLNFATRRLRELEPDNPQLESISDPNHVPNEAWVEAVEKEVRAAATRHKVLPAVPERSGLSMRDVVFPGGEPIGRQAKGADSNTRTVTPEEFQDIQNQLMGMKRGTADDPRYRGTWYVLPDGTRFGLRLSKEHGWTIDFDNPALPKRYKIYPDSLEIRVFPLPTGLEAILLPA
jgi:hypothetical protein